MNGRKGKSEEILDPFTLPGGWFELHFPSLQLIPNKDLNSANTKCIHTTIKKLKLNDDSCVNSRRNWLVPYLQGRYGMDHLEERAPFLASELKMQETQDVHLTIWEAFKKKPSIVMILRQREQWKGIMQEEPVLYQLHLLRHFSQSSSTFL